MPRNEVERIAELGTGVYSNASAVSAVRFSPLLSSLSSTLRSLGLKGLVRHALPGHDSPPLSNQRISSLGFLSLNNRSRPPVAFR